MSKITKTDIARMLASIEYSVAEGFQTEGYWFRSNMRQHATDLVARLHRMADKATTKGNGQFSNYLTEAQLEALVEMSLALQAAGL